MVLKEVGFTCYVNSGCPTPELRSRRTLGDNWSEKTIKASGPQDKAEKTRDVRASPCTTFRTRKGF